MNSNISQSNKPFSDEHKAILSNFLKSDFSTTELSKVSLVFENYFASNSTANIDKNTDSNTVFHTPLPIEKIEQILENNKLDLPSNHKKLLVLTDGIEIYGGYFRLFGLQNKINLLSWNDNNLWKFAWNGLADDYLCFAETAWGDQYAYLINRTNGTLSKEIYFIGHLTMEPEVWCKDFDDFFINDFLRNAKDPYDDILVEVRNKLGDLMIDEHITYVPSLLIHDIEDVDNVEKIEALSSMVFNGDLY